MRSAKVRDFWGATTPDIYEYMTIWHYLLRIWRVVCVWGRDGVGGVTTSNPREILSEHFPKCHSVGQQSFTYQAIFVICCFFLPGLSMLLQYERILSSEQMHKLKQTTHNVHKNACRNGLYKSYVTLPLSF